MNVEKKSYKTAAILTLVVVGMFGFGYATVPLYNVMCKKLGINGRSGDVAVNDSIIDKSRTITVQFLANNNANLPWKFYPLKKSIEVHPGESTKIAYFAENDSDKTMMVQAIPSVAPGNAAKYLKKTECFCFTQQVLKSKQSMEMPLLFHLDTHLPENVHIVTLSYTLFDVTQLKHKNIGNKIPGKIG